MILNYKNLKCVSGENIVKDMGNERECTLPNIESYYKAVSCGSWHWNKQIQKEKSMCKWIFRYNKL